MACQCHVECECHLEREKKLGENLDLEKKTMGKLRELEWGLEWRDCDWGSVFEANSQAVEENVES